MLYVIVNPKSSSGKGLRIWEEVEDILQDHRAEYECFLLRAPGQARQIARKLCQAPRPCTIVIVGGDGTINEVLSGLTTYEDIRFAYIPTGSGNDFARSLLLPQSPSECVRMILSSPHVRDINIGIASSGGHTRCFAVSSGIGYDAAVCRICVSSRIKKLLNILHIGKLIYLVGALRLLSSVKTMNMRILLDDSQTVVYQDVYFAAAMNMKYEGGGFMFCPKADPGDDELDLFIVSGLSRRTVLTMLPAALKGKHIGHQGVHILRCRSAVIETDQDACIHIDGESLSFGRKVAYSLQKKKLRLIVP